MNAPQGDHAACRTVLLCTPSSSATVTHVFPAAALLAQILHVLSLLQVARVFPVGSHAQCHTLATLTFLGAVALEDGLASQRDPLGVGQGYIRGLHRLRGGLRLLPAPASPQERQHRAPRCVAKLTNAAATTTVMMGASNESSSNIFTAPAQTSAR